MQELGETDAETLLGTLDEAVAAGMLVHVPGATNDFRFSHVLVRDALPRHAPDRPTLADPPPRRGSDPEAACAPIWSRTSRRWRTTTSRRGRSPTTPTAVQYATLAGRSAARRLAYEEAIRLFAAAVELAEQAGPRLTIRLDLLLQLGDTEARAGDLARRRQPSVPPRISRASGVIRMPYRAALGYGGRFAWSARAAMSH